MAAKRKTRAAAPKAGKAAKSGKTNERMASLRARDVAGLNEELIKLRREQFNLRMGRATGQMPKPDQWSKVRRSIARLKTVLGEKQAAAAAAEATETRG